MKKRVLPLLAVLLAGRIAAAADAPPVGAFVGFLESAGVRVQPGEPADRADGRIPVSTTLQRNPLGAPNFGVELCATGVEFVREAQGEAFLEDVGGQGRLYIEFAGDVLARARSVNGHLSIRKGYLMGPGVTYDPALKTFSPAGAEVVRFRGILELAATADAPDSSRRPHLVVTGSKLYPYSAAVMTVDSAGGLQSTDEDVLFTVSVPSLTWASAAR